MNESKYILRFRWIGFISGSLLVILMITAWIREGFLPEWKQVQSDYQKMVLENMDEKAGQSETSLRIYQVSPVGLNRTDRCMTCHLGMENPAMAYVPQPHTMHPGEFLIHHPVEKFGCTICHGGQGRAIDKIQAFGEEPFTHWDFPLLHPPYIESSCGKCHLGIFSNETDLAGTETYIHGKEIFQREGCLGCHQARGVGGIVGPDLTEQGEKTKHEYSFKNIQGEQTISNWLKEHFQDPEMVSPGSDMLQINLPEEELEALVTFTMGLAKPDISYDYIGVEALQEFRGIRSPLQAGQIYTMTCSACHGKTGEGKDYEVYKTGVPALGNYDFVRVVSGEMIMFTLLHGRGSRQMASWLPMHSGLKINELDSLVTSLDNQFAKPYRFEEIMMADGMAQNGQKIYQADCQMCHGTEGNGDIGLPLNNRDFLSVASDRFLFNTIVSGRNTGGMPAWTHYSPQQLADLISYIRTWGTGPPDDRSIDLPDGDPVKGDLQYHYLCSRCHGEFGEGNTGPAILTKDFQDLAGERYLDIIAYMRKIAGIDRDYIYQGRNPGDAVAGKDLFAGKCAECHGKEGEGLKAPALNNQEFLSAASNGYIMATISIGREGTKMPSWGYGSAEYQELTSTERKDLVAWIRSWQRFRIKR
jgi:mono/diheme cytochrome c family protein